MNRQFPLPLPHDEAMGADDLLVTAQNADAVAWLDKWPDWPGPCLAIHGPSGSGKTHLLHVWLARSGGRLIDPATLNDKDASQLIAGTRAIAIDDAEKIAGNALREETCLHIFNLLREAKGFLLLSSQLPPAQWGIKLADLRSRLAAAPSAALLPPDDALLSAMLMKQFRDRQINVSTEVIDYLLPRVTRTAASMREVVIALDSASLAERRGITVALARKLLEDHSFSNPRDMR
jgi:DnaA regulatory inactivator Hda